MVTGIFIVIWVLFVKSSVFTWPHTGEAICMTGSLLEAPRGFRCSILSFFGAAGFLRAPPPQPLQSVFPLSYGGDW